MNVFYFTFVFYFISVALLSALHSRSDSERKEKSLAQSSALPLFVSTGLPILFVLTCLSSLPGICSCLQTEEPLEQGHFTFTKHLLVLSLLAKPVILQCFIFRATGSNDERSK